MPAVKASFVASARTYGARRVWRDVLAEGASAASQDRTADAGKRSAGEAAQARPAERQRRTFGHRRSRRMFWIASSRRSGLTGNGLPTSLTSGQPRAGSMSPQWSICFRAA